MLCFNLDTHLIGFLNLINLVICSFVLVALLSFKRIYGTLACFGLLWMVVLFFVITDEMAYRCIPLAFCNTFYKRITHIFSSLQQLPRALVLAALAFLL
jgi:hypothetical protein